MWSDELGLKIVAYSVLRATMLDYVRSRASAVVGGYPMLELGDS